MSTQLIKLTNLHKTYNPGQENEFVALKGVDIEIDKGEFVAIMGPSGSGKSTVMNILGALDVTTSGTYLLDSQNINDYSGNQLASYRNNEIGFVFQQFNLLLRYTLLENVLIPTLYGDVENATEKAIELLKKVGLGHKINSTPTRISGGQVQRVAIARSLIMSPSIILADEPTGNLDTHTSEEIMEIFSQLHHEGQTIIIITHEESIASHAQRTITVRDGLVASDTKYQPNKLMSYETF
jgi:putative ABC transport system ATP-binding protein